MNSDVGYVQKEAPLEKGADMHMRKNENLLLG
jgi:hypothetical protein